MAGWRILAARNLVGRAEEAGDAAVAGRHRGIGIGGDRGRMAKAERHHVGQLQRTSAQSVAVAASLCAGSGDMTERIGPLVAETGRVGGAADPEGIQYEDECACHPQAWVNVAGLIADT